MSRPIRHTLPPELESGLFGSLVNGGCSSTSGTNNEICDGTSVLNDGIIPAVSGVSNDPKSWWANELLTMRRSGTNQMVVSVEVPNVIHNHVELTVFNCPQLGIYAPHIIVYVADSLKKKNDLAMVANVTLPDVNKCIYITKDPITMTVNNNIISISNTITNPATFEETVIATMTSTVPFEETIATMTSTTNTNKQSICPVATMTSTTNTNKQGICQCTVTTIITGAVSVIITALLVAGLSFVIHISVYQCIYIYKSKLMPITATAIDGESHYQRKSVTGSENGIVYDVVNERVETTLEMKENKAYSVNKRGRIETA